MPQQFFARTWNQIHPTLVVGTIVVLVARIGWLSDDSLITLRTALNVANGWGPGFNASESVQSYTHPLWFLLWLALGWISDQWIASVIFLSLFATTVALIIVLMIPSSWQARFSLLALIVLSNSFMEYSTSGLENPLSHLVVGTLLLVVMRQDEPKEVSHGAALGTTFALVALTRLDLILLVIPVLLVWTLRATSKACISAISFFIVPIATWSLWSYLAYNSLLPNTFLAKRNLDISAITLFDQGLFYLRVSLTHDYMGALMLFSAVLFSVLVRNRFTAACSAGTILYLAYVASNGGDFMVGRFLSVPVYVSVISIAVSLQDLRQQSAWRRLKRLATGSVVLRGAMISAIVLFLGVVLIPSAVSLSRDQSPRFNWERPESRGIADERPEFVQRGNGFMRFFREFSSATSSTFDTSLMDPSISEISRRANGWPRKSDSFPEWPLKVEVRCGLLGGKAIVSGPLVHWVDPCGLTDRVIASIRFEPPTTGWRVGHFEREIPAGYLQAVAENDPSFIFDAKVRNDAAEIWRAIRDD